MKSANFFVKYFFTFVVLMGLLLLTVFLAQQNFGQLNTWIGLLIALIKAVLVAMVFMNLRQSDGMHRVFAISGLFFLGILFSLALADYFSRGWLLMPGSFPNAN